MSPGPCDLEEGSRTSDKTCEVLLHLPRTGACLKGEGGREGGRREGGGREGGSKRG